MPLSEKDLEAKSQEATFEASKLISLLSLCEDRGISAGFSQADVETLLGTFHLEPTELGFIALRSRFASMRKHLHELLYAPPPRT